MAKVAYQDNFGNVSCTYACTTFVSLMHKCTHRTPLSISELVQRSRDPYRTVSILNWAAVTFTPVLTKTELGNG